MNRRSDVEVILNAVTQQYNIVRKDYDRALQDKSLDLRVPVKNLMENLRSALDYMAHDIYESCCQSNRAAAGQPDPKWIYFPYGQTVADFKAGLGRSLPDLETLAPDVFNLLLSIQPFSCGDTWLYDLCEILNEKKHDHLKAQERSESETYTVESQHGSVTIPANNPNIKLTSLPGAVEIFGVQAELRKDGIHTVPSSTLKHTRTRWVTFTFADTNVNVINLLNKATVSIKNFAGELYQMI